jgi:hypothetical protein
MVKPSVPWELFSAIVLVYFLPEVASIPSRLRILFLRSLLLRNNLVNALLNLGVLLRGAFINAPIRLRIVKIIIFELFPKRLKLFFWGHNGN